MITLKPYCINSYIDCFFPPQNHQLESDIHKQWPICHWGLLLWRLWIRLVVVLTSTWAYLGTEKAVYPRHPNFFFFFFPLLPWLWQQIRATVSGIGTSNQRIESCFYCAKKEWMESIFFLRAKLLRMCWVNDSFNHVDVLFYLFLNQIFSCCQVIVKFHLIM